MFKNQIIYSFFLLFFFHISSNIHAQNLTPALGEVFQDDVIPRIDIQLPPDSLAYIYDDQNLESNYHFHATFIFDNGNIRDTLEDVGFRLRGNTSRSAGKKSFKVSFNTYIPGRKYYGLEKMNLNGEHNDPTIFRSKMSWEIARQSGLVGSRCNHVQVYINDEYFGLYINVEHIDEEFVDKRFGNKDGNLYKCLWPADLHYLGNNPDSYKLVQNGRRVYDLKTNTSEDDYTKLANFIDVLNNTSTNDLPCELEQVFNVDQYLKYIAFDVLTSNWDGPIFNKNNFYLYENPTNGLIEYIPYDVDNTFGIDWFNINWAERDIYNWSSPWEDRPIYEKILAVEEYRNRYTYYLRNMVSNIFNENNLNPLVDSIKLKMDPFRMNDTYAQSDYGYEFSDYEAAFDNATGAHVKNGLKEYITDRYYAAISQWEQEDIEPILTEANNNYPNSTQEIVVKIKVEDDGEITNLDLNYQIDNSTPIIAPMFDDGMHGDGVADDGIYGIVLPAIGSAAVIDYFVHAVDDSGLENRFPRCWVKQIFIGESDLELYVNEFMASNNSVIADSNGEYDDWVEIYNGGTTEIFLGDKYLSDNLDNPNKWQMPSMNIQPGEFLIFWADNDDSQGAMHTNFKLSSSGEFIGIFDSQDNNFVLIDGEEYGALGTDIARARLPNGIGAFEQATPTPGASNLALSINNFLEKDQINIFPNPTSDVLNVYFEEKNIGKWNLEILDNLGQKIFEKNNLTDQFLTIPIQENKWTPGFYFIKIRLENGKYWTGKFIVND